MTLKSSTAKIGGFKMRPRELFPLSRSLDSHPITQSQMSLLISVGVTKSPSLGHRKADPKVLNYVTVSPNTLTADSLCCTTTVLLLLLRPVLWSFGANFVYYI